MPKQVTNKIDHFYFFDKPRFGFFEQMFFNVWLVGSSQWSRSQNEGKALIHKFERDKSLRRELLATTWKYWVV